MILINDVPGKCGMPLSIQLGAEHHVAEANDDGASRVMELRLLHAGDRVAVPWKNGGGSTREVAAFPPDANFDSFVWRASVATISSAGPFSSFPGVKRIMCVLNGQLELKVGDALAQKIDTSTPPIRFDGEGEVVARPLTEPATVLNFMTRDGFRANILPQVTTCDALVGGVILVAKEQTRVTLGDKHLELSAYDACHGRLTKNTPLKCDRPVIIITLGLLGAEPCPLVPDGLPSTIGPVG